jgi:hypothetical protein
MAAARILWNVSASMLASRGRYADFVKDYTRFAVAG